MRWAELITLRSTGRSEKRLRSALRELMRDRAGVSGRRHIRIYHRERVDTDYCIFLSHDTGTFPVGGSRLGVRLADALKAFGLVNHSVWSEMK